MNDDQEQDIRCLIYSNHHACDCARCLNKIFGWQIDTHCVWRKELRQTFEKYLRDRAQEKYDNEFPETQKRKDSKMTKPELEQLSDDELQEAEDLINEIQADRAAASPDPIDAERTRVLKGAALFFKRFGQSKTLMDLWK